MATQTPVTVNPPSMSEMASGAAAAIPVLGDAAAGANVSGQTIQLGGLLNLLQYGGAQALDPSLRAQYAALTSSVNKATAGPSRQLGNIQTRVTNDRAKLDGLKSQLADATDPKVKARLQRQITALEGRIGKFEDRAEGLQTRIAAQNQRVKDFEQNTLSKAPAATALLSEKFPELQATLTESTPYLDRMGQLGATGDRLMGALGQGYTAGNISADQVRASRMGDFGRANATTISAGQVGEGGLGQSLMQRAMSGIASGGRLGDQATRDAIQSARQGFAARGLATGNSALAAELLNRDRYSRQREFEDLAFAQGVQGQDLSRQFQNVGNQLTAAQSNQQAALQAETANLQARYNAAVQQGNWDQAAAIQNQSANLQATVANEEARRMGNQMNIGMLGQAFTTERMVNTEGLGAALQRGQLASAANPNNMLLSMFGAGNKTGSESVDNATSMANNWASNMLNAGMFNANATMWTNAANQYGNYGNQQTGFNFSGAGAGALSGAAAMAPTGNPYAIGAGAFIGGVSGGLSR